VRASQAIDVPHDLRDAVPEGHPRRQGDPWSPHSTHGSWAEKVPIYALINCVHFCLEGVAEFVEAGGQDGFDAGEI
jgi:hypothetical protein